MQMIIVFLVQPVIKYITRKSFFFFFFWMSVLCKQTLVVSNYELFQWIHHRLNRLPWTWKLIWIIQSGLDLRTHHFPTIKASFSTEGSAALVLYVCSVSELTWISNLSKNEETFGFQLVNISEQTNVMHVCCSTKRMTHKWVFSSVGWYSEIKRLFWYCWVVKAAQIDERTSVYTL